MGTLANAFALLADEQGNEASTIVALKTAEVKKIAEEKKKIVEEKKKIAEAKKKKKKRETPWKAKGNSLDGQANQEHKAVNHHGNGNQEKNSVRTVFLSKEELREQWLVREEERKKAEAERKELWLAREAERKERWLAREEERKKDMAMKTLKEYEEQKAYEKQKAEKTTMSVSEIRVTEATHDNIYTQQKFKDETVKKDNNINKDGKSKDKTFKKNSNIDKYWKVHKTMNIEEFLKLQTGSGQDDGPGRSTGRRTEYSWNKNRATYNQEYALPDADNTPDLNEISFPILRKANK